MPSGISSRRTAALQLVELTATATGGERSRPPPSICLGDPALVALTEAVSIATAALGQTSDHVPVMVEFGG